MGYYFDFVCDRGKVLSFDKIVNLICAHGAERLGDEVDPEFEINRTAGKKQHLDLLFLDPPFVITVWGKENSGSLDRFAHIRFSWSTDLALFEKVLLRSLELADAIGGRIYDGQIGVYVNSKNLLDIMKSFRNSSEIVLDFLNRT